MPEDIQLWRDSNGTAHASVPHRLKFHSPDGFEWGYSGSGPADLALNIHSPPTEVGFFMP